MKSVLIPDETGPGVRLVPMVVVVPEPTLDAIRVAADNCPVDSALLSICERAGWTPEMLIAGRVLRRAFPYKENPNV